MRSIPGGILLLATLGAAPVAAQLAGYNIPGSLAEKRLSAKEVVTRAYQDARWQIGFLRLEPQLALSELGYVSNIYSSTDEEAESDLKAQGVAGLRGFFHLGPKVLVSPFANLSYTWWQDQEDLRSTNDSYGLQLFGDLNRLQFGLQGGRVETQRNLSSELEVPVDLQSDRLQADLDVDFWGPLRLFATAAETRVRHSGAASETRFPGLDLSILDVDADRLVAGLAYELSNGLTVGLGYEDSESTYLDDPTGRSNRGSGPLVRVSFEGTRMSIDVEASERALEFDGSTDSPGRDQLIGVGRLAWRFTTKLTGSVYSGTRLDASALDSTEVFEGRRDGVALSHRGSGRARIGAFYETGQDEFALVTNDQVTRVDDFTSYGLNVDLEVTERLTVQIGFFDTRRDSSDPDFDRELRSLVGRVRLGADLLPW